MAIEKRQPGEAAAAAKAGTMIGAGEKAVREQAQAEQARQQQVAIKAREAAEQRAMEWELVKMEDQSRRAYEREMRQQDYALMAQDRAAEKAIERIEFSKDLEFQYETQERLRKLDVVKGRREALEQDADQGGTKRNSSQYKLAVAELDQDERQIETGITRRPQKEDAFEAILRSLTPGGAGGAGSSGTPSPPPTTTIPTANPSIQTATNPQTGEKVMSADGGQSWEPFDASKYMQGAPPSSGTFRDIPPATFKWAQTDPRKLIRSAPFFQRGK